MLPCRDLGLLKRDKKLQQRYDQWSAGIRKQYGSMVNYLLTHRLQWGKRDSLSMLHSQLDNAEPHSNGIPSMNGTTAAENLETAPGELPLIPAGAPSYFTGSLTARDGGRGDAREEDGRACRQVCEDAVEGE